MKKTFCILAVIIMSISLFSCSKSGGAQHGGIVYVSDNELTYRDRERTEVLSQIPEFPDEFSIYSYFNSPLEFCNYNLESGRLFYPNGVNVLRPRDGMSPVSVDLFYKNLKSGESVEVAKDVHSYQVSTDGNVVTYQDARTLYSLNLKTGEKLEIASGLTDSFAASANGEDVYYVINGALTKYNYFETETITEKNVLDIVLYDGETVFYTVDGGDVEKLCAYDKNGIFDITENVHAVKAGKNGEYFVFVRSDDKRSNSGSIYSYKKTKNGFAEPTVVAESAHYSYFEVDGEGKPYYVYHEDIFSEEPVLYCGDTVVCDDKPVYKLAYASGADIMYVMANNELLICKNGKLDSVYEYESVVEDTDEIVYEFEDIDYIVAPDGSVYVESETNNGVNYYALEDGKLTELAKDCPAYADIPKWLGIQRAPANPIK